jgi:GxxExxY protein
MARVYLKVFMKRYFATNLVKQELPFTRQVGVPLFHEQIKMDIGFRADIIIDKKVILELKSIEALAPVHF